MKYFGQEADIAGESDKKGVLLINLGSPERPVCPGLRKYLSEFLMDPRVIEIPALLRFILVKGIIINFRSHKSAATYRKIWTEEGSPLLTNSQRLAERTATVLGDDYIVEAAMRYGKPSITATLRKMHEQGIRELVVIPLYPQYSGSTNGSTFDALASALRRFRWVPKFHFINSYYQRKSYIAAIANSIEDHWAINPRAEKLVISFHGVPQKYITRGDPYQMQCTETAENLARVLGLADDEWMLVFQSRFGAEPWLQPYCDETLKLLPSQGVKSVDVVCPGFSADCLETLEEIDEENRAYFLDAGGESYSYIPCLNDHQLHAELMAEIVRDNVKVL
ncbi:MAG: ferrochelatase [Gammaproteobacteria bacterium]|nr:ferrochelatase [Gammaproteobacteria bacterium]